jgi:hypothetical protein
MGGEGAGASPRPREADERWAEGREDRNEAEDRDCRRKSRGHKRSLMMGTCIHTIGVLLFSCASFSISPLVLVMTRRLFWDDEENVDVDR